MTKYTDAIINKLSISNKFAFALLNSYVRFIDITKIFHFGSFVWNL